GTERNTEIKGCNIERGGYIDSARTVFLGELYHIELQAGDIRELQEAKRCKCDQCEEWRHRTEAEQHKHKGLQHDQHRQGTSRIVGRNAAANDVANSDRNAIEHQNIADRAFRKAGNVLQERCEICEGNESATVTERGHAIDDQQTSGAKHTE